MGPLKARTVVRVGTKRFRVGRHGVEVLGLINELIAKAPNVESGSWLLPHRGQIREMMRYDLRGFLTYVATQTHDERQRRLAIWLRGHCGGSFGTPQLLCLYQTASTPLRVTIVGALKRMHAWSALAHIERTATEPRLRQMAIAKPPERIDGRLRRFLQNPEWRSINRVRPKLVIADGVDFGGIKRHKPVWFIRETLERIQWLVRGPDHGSGGISSS